MNTKFEVSRLYLPWFHEIIFRLKIEETTAPRDASGRSWMLFFLKSKGSIAWLSKKIKIKSLASIQLDLEPFFWRDSPWGTPPPWIRPWWCGNCDFFWDVRYLLHDYTWEISSLSLDSFYFFWAILLIGGGDPNGNRHLERKVTYGIGVGT